VQKNAPDNLYTYWFLRCQKSSQGRQNPQKMTHVSRTHILSYGWRIARSATKRTTAYLPAQGLPTSLTFSLIWFCCFVLFYMRAIFAFSALAAEVRMKSRDVTVLVGQRLRLRCRSFGRPQPAVTWYKDGRPLQLDPRRVNIKTNRCVCS